MATWFEIIYTGEPTEDDCQRVSELAAQGFTSGELINEWPVNLCKYCQAAIEQDDTGIWIDPDFASKVNKRYCRTSLEGYLHKPK